MNLADDDEVDTLASGVSNLTRKTENVTTLPGFEASFTTKAGLFTLTNAADWPSEDFLADARAAVRGAQRKILQRHYIPNRPIFRSVAPSRRI